MSKITHEQVKRARNNLKKFLNSFPISNEYYAKDLNAILYYIEQRQEGDGVLELYRKYFNLNEFPSRNPATALNEYEELKATTKQIKGLKSYD